MESKRHLCVIPALVLGVALPALTLLLGAQGNPVSALANPPGEAGHSSSTNQSASSQPGSPNSTPAASPANTVAAQPARAMTVAPTNTSDSAGVLNPARQLALGMIETGNDDTAVGGAGEVSRYQIMPSVWKRYSESRRYRDPETARNVAQKHWTALHDYFKKRARREPTDFDMYVIWNTSPSYYASRGFQPARLGPVVRDRAERYSNLVEDGLRSEASLATTGGRG